MEDVSTYPKLVEELLRRGYSNAEASKIVGGNLITAMEKMEKAFDDRLNKALSRLGLPNKHEVEELEKRVQELTRALDDAEEKAPVKRQSRKKQTD